VCDLFHPAGACWQVVGWCMLVPAGRRQKVNGTTSRRVNMSVYDLEAVESSIY